MPSAPKIRFTNTDGDASFSCLRSKLSISIESIAPEVRQAASLSFGISQTGWQPVVQLIPHAQGTRHYFKRDRQTAHEFAIQLDSDLLVFSLRPRDHLFSMMVSYFVHAQVCA